MRELLVSSPERDRRQRSAATPAIEEPGPFPHGPFPVEYVSAVSAEPLRWEGVRWHLAAHTIARTDLSASEVLPSWPFFATWGTTVWGEPRIGGPTSLAPEGSVSTDELLRIEQPDRIGGTHAGERWVSLVIKAFPHLRSMTADEAAAYRAFKRKVSRRVGRIEFP